jgi:hypothetical protein
MLEAIRLNLGVSNFNVVYPNRGGTPGIYKVGGASWTKTWPKTNLVWAQTDSVRLKRAHTDPYMGSA